MLNREKCTHCGGAFSDIKPVISGPRQGLFQKVCTKCSHIKYLEQTPPAQAQKPAQQTQPQAQAQPQKPKKFEWSF
jgi:hypothetical protein